jgi:hypothetical protein
MLLFKWPTYLPWAAALSQQLFMVQKRSQKRINFSFQSRRLLRGPQRPSQPWYLPSWVRAPPSQPLGYSHRKTVKRTVLYIYSFNSRTAIWKSHLYASVCYRNTLYVPFPPWLVGPRWWDELLYTAYSSTSSSFWCDRLFLQVLNIYKILWSQYFTDRCSGRAVRIALF